MSLKTHCQSHLVTVYEHAMVGANLALATGLHHRYGWRITVLAAIASALPDWDSLSILFGPQAYARVHRVWGHNLLVAGLSGGTLGLVEYLFCPIDRIYRRAMREMLRRGWNLPLPPAVPHKESFVQLLIWPLTGTVASLSHLLADLFYSGGRGLQIWPLPLLWPFSKRSWTFPLVAWGDFGATLIFAAEMFLLYYYWPKGSRLIAIVTLFIVSLYIATHIWLGPTNP
jgi:hypothetical protein